MQPGSSRLFRVLVLLPSVVAGLAAQPDTLWTRTYGGTGYDVGRWVERTFDAGYVIGGYSVSFGSGRQCWLVKLDSAGNQQWARAYGGSGSDYCYFVQQTSDSGYVLSGGTDSYGPCSSAAYVVKTKSNGDTAWTRALAYDQWWHSGYCVRQCRDGGYVVAGSVGAYGMDRIYLARLDAGGNRRWHRSYDCGDITRATGVVELPDSGFIAVGAVSRSKAWSIIVMRLDKNGDSLWTRTTSGAGASSIEPVSDGGYVVTGYIGQSSYSPRLVRLDSTGAVKWAWTYPVQTMSNVSAARELPDGGFIAAGYTGTVFPEWDLLLLRTASDGTKQWHSIVHLDSTDVGQGVCLNPDGSYTAAGYTDSRGAGDDDYWLVQFRADTTGVAEAGRAAGRVPAAMVRGRFDSPVAAVLVDACGRPVATVRPGTNRMEGIAAGVYYLLATGAAGRVTGKLVVVE